MKEKNVKLRVEKDCFIMFHQVQTWRAIRAMCTDPSLKEGHVYDHASNYLAVDYLTIATFRSEYEDDYEYEF